MKPQVSLVLFAEGPRFPYRDWVEAGQGLALLRREGMRAQALLVRNAHARVDLAAKTLANPPKIIFLLVGRDQTSAALAFLHEIRSLRPTTHVIVGGTWGTLCSHDFTLVEIVSCVLLGEWVEGLCEYAVALAHQGDPGEVPGAFLHGLRGWRLTERRIYNPDLAKWPYPEYDGLRAPELIDLCGGAVPITASRGFPFQSLFSTEPLHRHLQKSDLYYHMRPTDIVVEEARSLCGRYRLRSFNFVDDLFPWLLNWQLEFVDRWTKRVQLPFRIRSAAEYISEESIVLLKNAGLAGVELCIESGDETLRRRLTNMNETNERLYDAMELCARLGIETRLRIMAGVPGESAQSLRESVEVARIADATETIPELFEPWPESTHWNKTEQKLTGGTSANRIRFEAQTAIAREITVALDDMEVVDTLNRSRRRWENDGAILDAMASVGDATVRSAFEGAARIKRFQVDNATHEVIALRVPAQIAWNVELPASPAEVMFGIGLEARFPGDRIRLPISFSVLVEQDGRSFRLFHKVLLQALDPDSRTFHQFRIPLAGVHEGPAVLALESTVFGEGADAAPPGEDIWAGWGSPLVRVASEKKKSPGPA